MWIPKHIDGKVYYAECDICGHFHTEDFDGDCRDDSIRFTWDELDAKHGIYGTENCTWELECFSQLIEVPDEEVRKAA